MAIVTYLSPWILLATWLGFSGLLAANHLRVRTARRTKGIPENKPSLRDGNSMKGLALEGLSFAIAFGFAESAAGVAEWRHVAGMVSGSAAVLLLWRALRHLDLEWRVKAVVTEDHRLVTTGPYAVIRHPIFAALFALLLATALILTKAWAGALAVAVCLYGTEMRVRAEEGLLERRFGERFEAYRKRTNAYLPFVR